MLILQLVAYVLLEIRYDKHKWTYDDAEFLIFRKYCNFVRTFAGVVAGAGVVSRLRASWREGGGVGAGCWCYSAGVVSWLRAWWR